ncbi:DUF7500 family protein [Natronorubrum sp. DTA28]|uniref:DUF7500 family protein n=1 Tax=Natronorubrum sp. DTA28 TaxID=3447019 RepID=UPI003F87F121
MTTDPTEDDGILSPDELQLDDTSVAELGENRFLVRSCEPDTATDPTAEAITPSAATEMPEPLAELEGDAHEHNGTPDSHDLVAAPEPHGVDITLKTDWEVAHHRATSHDVREVFVDLLTWYAGQLDDDMSPEEALQVMLAASDLDVALPSR